MKVHITYELARSLNQRVCAILGVPRGGRALHSGLRKKKREEGRKYLRRTKSLWPNSSLLEVQNM